MDEPSRGNVLILPDEWSNDFMNSVTVWSGGKLELGKIPLLLERSTVPVLRNHAEVYLSVSPDAIHVEAIENSNGDIWPLLSGGPGGQEIFEFDLATRASIQSVSVDAGWTQITILHDDPYGVVAAFRTAFTSNTDYWIKAFAKMLKDRFGIVTEVERDPGEPF